MLGERTDERALPRLPDRDPVGVSDDDLPLDWTLEGPPLRSTRGRPPTPPAGPVQRGAELLAVGTGGAGAILMVITYAAILGGMAGLPTGVDLAMNLSPFAQGLLILSAPFAVIAWGRSR